jgi:hypothetical protein
MRSVDPTRLLLKTQSGVLPIGHTYVPRRTGCRGWVTGDLHVANQLVTLLQRRNRAPSLLPS